MKQTKLLFWISTILLFLWEGVMPALTSQTEMAKEGIRHLGYPAYFGVALVVFKVLGSLALLLPFPTRIKEWTYAGFGFTLLFAIISHTAVDGVSLQSFFPLIIFFLLVISYVTYHKLDRAKNNR